MKPAAFQPAPTKGAVVALYKPPFSVWDIHEAEERKGLVKVERVTLGGQITVTGGLRFDKSGTGVGRSDRRLAIRWPTDPDRADYRRTALTEALCDVAWGARSDEEREAVAKLLKIEVRDP